MAWLVVWFVLGYAIYATAYGAFGSLASRTEDASSISAPVTTLLIVAYWASLVAVTRDPDGGWAPLTSFVPVTAPVAMPGRVALGAAAWWEPFLAAGLTVAGIAVLVLLAGRIYTGAILHTGAPLKLREAWRRRIERIDSWYEVPVLVNRATSASISRSAATCSALGGGRSSRMRRSVVSRNAGRGTSTAPAHRTGRSTAANSGTWDR